MTRLDGMGWLLLILGPGAVANALWRLAGPMHGYEELPAAVLMACAAVLFRTEGEEHATRARR